MWNKPSQNILISMSTTVSTGMRLESMLWICRSWCATIPSMKPPIPMPKIVPAVVSGFGFMAVFLSIRRITPAQIRNGRMAEMKLNSKPFARIDCRTCWPGAGITYRASKQLSRNDEHKSPHRDVRQPNVVVVSVLHRGTCLMQPSPSSRSGTFAHALFSSLPVNDARTDWPCFRSASKVVVVRPTMQMSLLRLMET